MAHEQNQQNTYFAALSGEETADILMEKVRDYNTSIRSSGYLNKLYRLYSTYHGMAYDGSGGDHEIVFEGEQEELASINVNHLRNLGQNMLNLITASRPTMEARAVNTDYKSRVQTKLANGLLDYYMREKKLESLLHDAVELSIAQATGWVRVGWNAMAGDPLIDEETGEEMYDEELQTYIYEGDATFDVLSPHAVIFDNLKEHRNHDWYVVKTWKNKFDIIAKYPHLEDEILAEETKTESDMPNNYLFNFDETSDIAIYEFFHKRTESMPDGRYMMFINRDAIFADQALPYPMIPLFRISPSFILGTSLGYTPLFDIMPLQDAANMLYSTILTNQQAFGVQNIYVPRGADISLESLAGGLNIIEGNAGAGEPKAMNFTSTPKEVFEYLSMIIQTMETLSGINSVIRGNPEANLRSGSALALIQSNSIQFMSGLANQYNQLIEDVGSCLLLILKQYADTKRVAAIVGENNRSYLQEFSRDDLSNIRRVVVSAGNPLSKTTAGKLQIASELLQYQLLETPEQYISLIETGELGVVTEKPFKAENLLISENEMMMSGELPITLASDQHSKHINSHLSLLDDARMRQDPQLVQIVTSHVMEHKEMLKNADPILLQIRGEQPIPPDMPPIGPDGQPLPPLNVPPMPGGEGVANLSEPAGAISPAELPVNPAEPAKPPEGFENAPTSGVELQQQLRTN